MATRIGDILAGTLVALFLVVATVFSIWYFSFNLIESLILIGTNVILYLLVVIVLSMSAGRRVVRRPIPVRTVNAPIIAAVADEPKEDRKSPDEYIGSTETQTYHKRTCRFSKLIKNKYKLTSNNTSFFKDKKYKPCKICIRK